jgi:hypothetical protein
MEHTDKKVLDLFKSKFNFRPIIFERAERSINQKKRFILCIFLLNWIFLK